MQDAPSRGGRPPLPPEQRRTVEVRLRLTAREADAAYRIALRRGLPLAEMVRNALARLADQSA